MTLNPTRLIQQLKNLIEQLYHYKQSLFFKLHFAVIVLIGIAILWVYLQQSRQSRLAYSSPQKAITRRVEPEQYIDTIKQQTRRQVQKLRQSRQFKHFMGNRDNPKSFYNRQLQEVSEIILSDDEDDPRQKIKKD